MSKKDLLAEEFYVFVQDCGNSAHIRLSKKWLGKRVKVRIEESND